MTTRFSEGSLSRVDKEIFPASAAQQYYWFLEQGEPGSVLTTVTARVQVQAVLTAQALEAGLRALVQRQDALRSTFALHEGALVQRIAAEQPIAVQEHDLRALSPHAQEAEVQRVQTAQQQEPLGLSEGPLWRCALVHLGAEHSLVLLHLHRLIADPGSLAVLVRDLACLVGATDAQPISLPGAPDSSAQVGQREREAVESEAFAADLAYWQQQVAQAPVLQLPLPPQRSAHPDLRAVRTQCLVPPALVDALHTLAQQQQVSQETLLVATFATLLGRLSGQHDLLLGTLLPCTRSAQSQSKVGSWENPLPLRLDLSGTPSMQELAPRVQAVLHEAQQHAAVPLSTLLKAVFPTPVPEVAPLFQALLRLPAPQPTLPQGWHLAPVQVGGEMAQFALTLELDDAGQEGLLARFTARRDGLDAALLERIAGYWMRLLEGLVATPQQPLERLPLLSAQERHLLLEEWTATQRAFPPAQAVQQLVEAQVQRSPEALALLCEGETLSYGDLNRQANQLAHLLRGQGVGPETVVALLCERGIAWVRMLLAIFKAGGAYLPLDPQHPPARLRGVLQQSGCALVLSTGACATTLVQALSEVPAAQRPRCLLLEELDLEAFPATNPALLTEQEHLAYVIYTSGSTGRPKGAMVEQRGMLNHLFAKIEALALEAQDTVAQTASHCFDISVWQVFAPLLVGARVQIYPDAVAHDARLLLQQVEAQQITILETVPSLLQALLQAQERAAGAGVGLRALRWLIPTGEALPVDLCRRWLTRYPHVPLLNAYGPTECSDDVTHYVLAQPPQEGLRSIPIGRAIPNLRLYVLDASLVPQPIGVSGEIYVGGVGVGRGYLGEPERTKAAFVPDPFVQEAGARLYKTGDRGRYLPDGTLEFVGRLDEQVKLRGYRIELGEIEAVLRAHPGVEQAVVVVRQTAAGERLVAYVVRRGQVTMQDLRQQVRQQVPAYMVPTGWVWLEALPLTANGKLDRAALPEPEGDTSEQEQASVAARTEVERALVAMWEDLLGVRPIGITDDFFALGGESLQAVQLFEQIEQRWGKRLSLATLFAGATIAQVGRALEQEERVGEPGEAQTRTPVVQVQAGGAGRPFFFLHGQWEGGALYSREVARALGPEQPFYHLDPYRFEGLAVPPTLEEVAAAHLEVLRRVQPEGPYLFGGWCNGGLIAYEMARQLHAQGQIVDLLVLMDSDAPAPRFELDRRIISGLVDLLRLGQEKQVDWFLLYRHLRLSFYHWRVNKLKGKKIAKKDEPGVEQGIGDIASPQIEAIIPKKEVLRQEWLSIYDWIAAGYMPHPYSGKITFFWTEEEPLRRVGWHKLIEGKDVDTHIIPGNHITSRTQYLPVLAEHLRICLDKAQSRLLSEQ